VKELRSVEGNINLRINSPGGDVFAARAMEQALREHSGKVVTYIDGIAASAASYLALAADEVQIAAGGFYMIHKAWTMAYGNEHDFLSTASLLGKIDESLVNTYAAETGQDAQQLRDWMTAETWFTAEEAVKYGFADGIAASAVKDTTQWDLSAYSKAPGAKNTGPAVATINLQLNAADFATDIRAMVERLLAESGVKPKETTTPAKNSAGTDQRRRALALL
jgi:ATP-dependent Clp protease protease subunit